MSDIVYSKTKTELFVENFLASSELEGISQTISNAYSAVAGIYKSTPALGAFMIGFDLRPHLLRVFTEHALQKFADSQTGFTHEVRQNIAKNCSHLRLFKNGLALTSHYMGARCERPEGRKALYKWNLSERNLNLFEFEDDHKIEDFSKTNAYAQIMHGGIVKPMNILINIPSRDQSKILGTIKLPIITENKTQVEEILDEKPFKLKDTIEELKYGNKKTS